MAGTELSYGDVERILSSGLKDFVGKLKKNNNYDEFKVSAHSNSLQPIFIQQAAAITEALRVIDLGKKPEELRTMERTKRQSDVSAQEAALRQAEQARQQRRDVRELTRKQEEAALRQAEQERQQRRDVRELTRKQEREATTKHMDDLNAQILEVQNQLDAVHDKLAALHKGPVSGSVPGTPAPERAYLLIDEEELTDKLTELKNRQSAESSGTTTPQQIPLTKLDFPQKTEQLATVITSPTGTNPTGGAGPGTPLNRIPHFYKNVISQDIKFYEQFFTLVEVASGDAVALNTAMTLSGSDLERYSLKVKSDFLSILPDKPVNIIINDAVTLTVEELTELGGGNFINGLRKLFGDMYDRKSDSITETIFARPITINVAALVKAFTTGVSGSSLMDLLNAQLSVGFGGVPSDWIAFNDKLGQAEIAAMKGHWSRDDDKQFVLKDNDGKVVAVKPEDTCALLGAASDVCMKFFRDCLESGEPWPTTCNKLFNDDADILMTNLAPTVIEQYIEKVEPLIAWRFLQKLGFDRIPESDSSLGTTLNKVETIGSWLARLKTDEKLKAHFGTAGDYDMLIKKLESKTNTATTSKAHNFLNFLAVMREWVNHHAQALNPELADSKGLRKGGYPEPSKEFNQYHWRNPYKSAKERLVDLSCGLSRLKSSLINDMTGINGESAIANIIMTPSGVQSPLNKFSYMYPSMIQNISMMGSSQFGGGDLIKDQVEKFKSASGYKVFKAWFDAIKDSMHQISNEHEFKFTEGSNKKMEDQFEKLKKVEEEFLTQLVTYSTQVEIYKESDGMINAFRVQDNELEKVLEKHAAKLKYLGHAYQKRGTNLVEMMNTIVKALYEKANKELTAQDKDKKYEKIVLRP